MKYIVVICFLTGVGFSQDCACAKSYQVGANLAASTDAEYGPYGFLGGVLLGPIGIGIAMASSQTDAPETVRPVADTTIIRICYVRGYAEEMQRKNYFAALNGGMWGTVCLGLLVWFIAAASN
jgi:hypothetical protein